MREYERNDYEAAFDSKPIEPHRRERDYLAEAFQIADGKSILLAEKRHLEELVRVIREQQERLEAGNRPRGR